jgi:TRAP-type C4-dicarboxylate transport system permease small subunit
MGSDGRRGEALMRLLACSPSPASDRKRGRGGGRPCSKPHSRGPVAGITEERSIIAIRYLVAVIQGFAAVLLLVAVAINAANITGRYCAFRCETVLHSLHLDPVASVVPLHPIEWAEEIMLFLLVGMVFLGNAVVGFEGRSLRMDIILQALPSGLRRVCDVAADLVMIAVSLTLIVLGWPAVQMLAEFDQRSQVAEIPMVIPQALVPIGLGLNALLVVVRLIASRQAPPSARPQHQDSA